MLLVRVAIKHLVLSVIMLAVIMLSVFMLSVIMIYVIIPGGNVINLFTAVIYGFS